MAHLEGVEGFQDVCLVEENRRRELGSEERKLAASSALTLRCGHGLPGEGGTGVVYPQEPLFPSPL